MEKTPYTKEVKEILIMRQDSKRLKCLLLMIYSIAKNKQKLHAFLSAFIIDIYLYFSINTDTGTLEQ